MNRLALALVLCAPLCVPLPGGGARAQDEAPEVFRPVHLHLGYAIYAAGLNSVRVEADADLNDTGYGLRIGFRTVGLYGAIVHGDMWTTIQGLWRGDGVQPLHLASAGTWHGTARRALIDYQGDHPLVRALLPPNEQEREPVPDALQEHTVDTLSAIALLVHRVALTGRCDGAVRTYDGRRLSEITARTVGEEDVPRSGRSVWSGRALRCDFDGRLIAGFRHDDKPAVAGRPKHGTAWLAPLTPGGPPLPVRMVFDTAWFGAATMYLTDIAPGGAAGTP